MTFDYINRFEFTEIFRDNLLEKKYKAVAISHDVLQSNPLCFALCKNYKDAP